MLVLFARGSAVSILALACACGSARQSSDEVPNRGGDAGTGGDAGRSGGSTASGGTAAGGSSGKSAGTAGSTGGSAGTNGALAGSTGTAGSSGNNGGSDAGGSNSSGGTGPAGGADASGGEGAGTAGDGGGNSDEPRPGEYGERPALLAANSEMAVAELDRKIYVVGGYPASRVIQDAVQIYDTDTGEWSLGTPLPVPLHHPVAAAVNGKLYSLGGQLAMSGDTDTDRTLEYDPATEAWLDLAPMPTPRGAGAAGVIGDKIYVVGGRPPAGNAFEVYDVSDDAWTELPALPTAIDQRNHLAAAAIGGKLYVAGGRYDGGSFSDPMTDAVDVFDPAENAWSPALPLPRPRGGVNGIAAYGCFHVWGGEGSNTGEPNDVFPDHDVYDPRSDSWTSLGPLPTPVHGVTGAAFVDGVIYMPGGGTQSGGSSGSALFQVYRPDVRCE